MAHQVNKIVSPVTAETHKFTHNCEFTGEEFVGLITKAGFKNLLEAHIRSLNKAKQVSYTRNQEWLDAIQHGSDMPPSGYAGNQASWRNEIGATNLATSKWIVEGDRVYKKSGNARESGAMTPTERIYELMTSVHQAHGHKGRDNFYKLVQRYSGSIKKAFCGQFVQVCCQRAELWEAGGNVKYDFKPEVRRRAAREKNLAAAAPAAVAEDVDDNQIVGKPVVDEADDESDGVSEEMLVDEADNFEPEVVNGPHHHEPYNEQNAAIEPEVVNGPYQHEPYNEQNAAIEPQFFEMGLNAYGKNNAGIFQQMPLAQEVQMDDLPEIDFNQYNFDQYNFDQYHFPGQEGNPYAYVEANAHYPGQVQPNYLLSNNDMVAEQDEQDEQDMGIGLDDPIMYDNYAGDDDPAPWQLLPMVVDYQALQPAPDNSELPLYDMGFQWHER